MKLLVHNDGGEYVIEMGDHVHKYATLELLLKDIRLLFINNSKSIKSDTLRTNKE